MCGEETAMPSHRPAGVNVRVFFVFGFFLKSFVPVKAFTKAVAVLSGNEADVRLCPTSGSEG